MGHAFQPGLKHFCIQFRDKLQQRVLCKLCSALLGRWLWGRLRLGLWLLWLGGRRLLRQWLRQWLQLADHGRQEACA